MTLFISNPSTQLVEFQFRLVKVPKEIRDVSAPHRVAIPSGTQVEIGHGWTLEQQGYVIEQIEKAGGAHADVAYGIEKFTGLLYREIGHITVEEIQVTHQKVVEDAEQRSVAQATRGAAVFDRVANKNQGRQKGRQAQSTSVEIVQELERHEHRTGKEVKFDMTFSPDGRDDVRVPGL